MTRRRELPPSLDRPVFAVGAARALGVTPSRLRAADLEMPFRGTRRVAGRPVDLRSECAAYALVMAESAAFCGVTAARLHGIPLPLPLERSTLLHVAVPAPARAPSGRRIRGRAVTLRPGDAVQLAGLRVTSASRTWCDLGAALRLDELVAAADHLIHHRHPAVSATELAAAVGRYPSRRGIRSLRSALPLLDERSESPAESRLRVLLHQAGITGFRANLVVRIPGERGHLRVDLAFPEQRVAVEYQGEHHADLDQWRRDMTRISRLESAGWRVVQVNARDLDDPPELARRIRRVLAGANSRCIAAICGFESLRTRESARLGTVRVDVARQTGVVTPAHPEPRARRRPALLAAALLAVAVLAGCVPQPASTASDPLAAAPAADTDGPDAPFVDAGSSGYTVVPGDDWTLPAWARPAANSGFFSEEASPADRVLVRSVDLSWRQLQPEPGGALDRSSPAEAQGMSFDSLDAQLDDEGAFWMRIFASGVDWAPEWVAAECGVRSYGPDYDGQEHLPIWDECVWGHLLETYESVFVEGGLAADPRLRFVYVPGAFTWAEYDYEMVTAAVEAGDLDLETYRSWYDHAWTDLVELFGEHSTKLVFTGEDHPFGPWEDGDDLFAKQAVDAGMGIRSGITELANFHLSEAPAYGSAVQEDGHMIVDESLPVHDGRFVVATENECYTDCGYESEDPYYSVRQSNLKALQLRMNWIYVVPGPSYMAEHPEHWDWVRLSQGQNAHDSADAWAALRDATDTSLDRDIRNLERWLVQVDEPGSVAHRSEADVHVEDIEPDNGTAWEGLSTHVAEGDTGFAFEVDERFAAAASGSRLVAKITYLDEGAGSFAVDTAAGSSAVVPRGATGKWVTATVALPEGGLGDGTRMRLSLGAASDDLVVRFVRLVRVDTLAP